MLRSNLWVSTFALNRSSGNNLHQVPFTLFCEALSKPSRSVCLGGIELERFLEAFRSAVRVRRVRQLQVIHSEIRKCWSKRRGTLQSRDETLVRPIVLCRTALGCGATGKGRGRRGVRTFCLPCTFAHSPQTPSLVHLAALQIIENLRDYF